MVVNDIHDIDGDNVLYWMFEVNNAAIANLVLIGAIDPSNGAQIFS